MTWINKYKRLWRTAVLILLLTSITGPWIFDRIYVPAQYPCSPPNYRLAGDFCGIPFAGIWFYSSAIGHIFNLTARLFAGEIALTHLSLEMLWRSLFLLPLLPFFTTLLLIFQGDRHLKLALAGWGAALIMSLFLGLTNSFRPSLVAWGIWLYIGLAIVALVLELFVFRSRAALQTQHV